jgi:hypothetical protein
MRDSERRAGISIHRIAVGGDIMGALFAIGSVLIFVVGVPLGPWFLLGSILLGTVVAVGLYAEGPYGTFPSFLHED